MATILSPDDARKCGRPIGKVDADKLQAFITEVEQTIVRRRLGDSFYIELLTFNHETDDKYKVLLEGGQFTDADGAVHILNGLKIAESYYVYAQNVRAGDFESTRYGMVRKENEYSNPISTKERDAAANNATEIANVYMDEVVSYCIGQGFITPNDIGKAMNLTAGCVIRKIKS